MLQSPYWLSSPSAGKSVLGVDELTGEELESYTESPQEFIRAFESEKLERYKSDECTRILKTCWEKGTFSYIQALDYPSALYAIFLFHVQPCLRSLRLLRSRNSTDLLCHTGTVTPEGLFRTR